MFCVAEDFGDMKMIREARFYDYRIKAIGFYY